MKKKKLVRNSLIAIAVVLVVVCVIVLSILLKEDVRGLNYFDRNKIVATAAGQSVTMGEYVVSLDNMLSYYAQVGYSVSDEDLAEMKTNVIKQLLEQKVYVAKMSELGLSFTEEELQENKQSALDQLNSLEESFGKQMASSENFSKASLESQINSYYTRQLGMSKSRYRRFVEQQSLATLAQKKIREHFSAQTTDYTEEDLLAYYNQYVTENYADSYESGAYSMGMQMYEYGYSTPYLYVPEGFVYIDVIELEGVSEAEIDAFYARYVNGESFSDLQEDPLNARNPVEAKIPGPYAIGDLDYGYIAANPELYKTASEMEIGEVRLLVNDDNSAEATAQTEDDSEQTVAVKTAYLIRRTEGNMCQNGEQHGIVDIDYYTDVRVQIKSTLEEERFREIVDAWIEDVRIEDAAYAYSGN